jgi:hypothetical protein
MMSAPGLSVVRGPTGGLRTIEGINGIHHVSITVPDFQRALQFYCDGLGFEKVLEFHWPAPPATVGRIPPPLSLSVVEAMAHLKRIHQLEEFHE